MCAYWGVLFKVLEGSDPILKWSLAILTLNVLPEIVSWEYDVYDKLIRSRLMGYMINPLVGLAKLDSFKWLFNTYMSKCCNNYKFERSTICTKEIIFIDRELERALEFIHEMSPELTDEYSHIQWGMLK